MFHDLSSRLVEAPLLRRDRNLMEVGVHHTHAERSQLREELIPHAAHEAMEEPMDGRVVQQGSGR